jgi:hypothetical protein
MTETQAKAGAEDAAASQAEDGSEAPAADGVGSEASSADGHAVVGRATVPAETSASSSSDSGSADHGGPDKSGKPTATGAASVPKFTRAPGMAPPPETLMPSQSSSDKNDAASTAGTPAAPTVGPGAAVARATVRGAAAVGRGAAAVGRGSGLSTQPITTGERPGAPGGGPPGGASRVTEAIRSARATVTAAASRGPRRARLYLKRVDPWSVMKFSFAVSFVLFIVGVVATAVLYMALDTMGVVGSVNKALSEMVGATGGDTKSSFKITARGVIVGSALLGLVNVVLFTALATLSAFIYNVCSDLVGGIELTLAEKE